jgi:hypothetical protein
MWKFLNGKKSLIGLGCLFIYGGLSYLGYEMSWLQGLGEWVLAGGVVHKLDKASK